MNFESLDAFAFPVFVLDVSGRLRHANRPAWNRLGYRTNPPPDDALLSGPPPSHDLSAELSFRSRSGKGVTVRCLIVPWQGVLLAVGAASERGTRESVSELLAFREALGRFLVNDLNTILTGVLGSIQVLRMDDNTNLTEGQRRLVENAHRSGHELRKMIQNIVDVTKLEGSHLQLKLEAVPVATLFQRVMDDYSPVALMMQKKLKFRLADPSLMVRADLDMMLRVLSNLVSNALKYAPRRGEILVESDITDEGWVWLAVSDTGPGIARQYQEKIFEKFFQIDLEKRRKSGAGIGLAFCKLAVEAHGGHVWVESEPGEGSRFKFTLPAT